MAGSLLHLVLRQCKSAQNIRSPLPLCNFPFLTSDGRGFTTNPIYQWTESNRSTLSCGQKSPTSCCGSSKPLDPSQRSSRSYHSTATPTAVDKSVSRFELTSSTARGLTSDSTRARGTAKSRGSARLSSRSLQISSPSQYQAKLTPAEVTVTLRANEYTNSDLPTGPIKSYDMNTLRSNNPIEDAHSEALLWNGGYLFGIYDGHGGAACGQVVAKRLLNYVAAGLLGHAEIEMHLKAMHSEDTENQLYSLLKILNENFELVQDLKDLYQKSYVEYLELLSSRKPDASLQNLESVLTNAFIALDEDMSREAHPAEGEMVNMKTLTVAMSGCVAVVAHIDGPHLHVASTGDCTAVIGSLSETGTWIAKKLTTEHNSDNVQEVKRILSEHPETEHHHIIKGDRLLSMLAPLRAFGDFKFKWSKERIESTLGSILGNHACPPNYKTPPYLTAMPEVTYHRLTARDRFLVLGSDGLWDMMTPMQVIRLVGEHMSGKLTLSPLHLSQPHIPLEDIASLLRQREAAMKLKPADANAATHLIRCALGGTAYGVDHSRLSQMLSLPQDMVRMFRDDMTITVIFFDDEYLRHC